MDNNFDSVNDLINEAIEEETDKAVDMIQNAAFMKSKGLWSDLVVSGKVQEAFHHFCIAEWLEQFTELRKDWVELKDKELKELRDEE